MNISLKSVFESNNFLIIISLIIGYCLWSLLSNNFQASLNLDIPISFYNKQESNIIESPEFIKIELKGKKDILNNLDKQNLVIHIDAQELKSGDQLYAISNKNIFLPNGVFLNNYSPNNFIIKLNSK